MNGSTRLVASAEALITGVLRVIPLVENTKFPCLSVRYTEIFADKSQFSGQNKHISKNILKSLDNQINIGYNIFRCSFDSNLKGVTKWLLILNRCFAGK